MLPFKKKYPILGMKMKVDNILNLGKKYNNALYNCDSLSHLFDLLTYSWSTNHQILFP